MVSNNKERAYLKSHPWITFKFDTRSLDYHTWILCGEAKSKCLHIIGAPLLPEVKKDLFQIALAKGALATTAIEGNTLSVEEVERRIQGKLVLPPSKEYLGIEIDNIVNAYNKIGKMVLETNFTKPGVKNIMEFNKMVLENLPLDEGVVPGEIRKYQVGVGRYRGAPVDDCEYLLERFVDWLNQDFPVQEGQKMVFGILKAIVSHLYFVWIHPFGDGNGRTARLIEFQILLSVGVPAASAHLMSNHYNATRSEYYRQLDLSSKSNGDISSFIKYALQGFVDGLKDQIDTIQNQQMFVHWVNHVHNTFADKDRTEDKRRRKLILALSAQTGEIPVDEVRHISSRIAEMYAGVSEKTVQRDVEKLLDLNLIVKDKKGIRPKWELLSSFLSPSVARNRS